MLIIKAFYGKFSKNLLFIIEYCSKFALENPYDSRYNYSRFKVEKNET